MKGAGLKIGVAGVGAMGAGIAQIAAQAGHHVFLYDARDGAAVAAEAAIKTRLWRLADKGQLSQEDATQAMARLQPVADLGGFAGADVVFEAIAENLEAKRKLFADLEGIVGPEALLATNTSSLSVTAIARDCADPGRVCGAHFFNPVPLMKVVEIIAGARSSADTVSRMAALVESCGHRAVICRDTPGFLVNHAGRGLYTEGLRIVFENIAGPVDVDRVMREAAGFRMGPFELFDLTGIDVSCPVLEQIYHHFFEEPRFRPTPLPRQRVDAGLLGRKAGLGFYEYREGRQIYPPERSMPREMPKAVWIGGDARHKRVVTDLVASLGVPIDGNAAPRKDSLCLLAPVGVDATSSALDLGLDPARTVAIDPLFGLGSRRCLMPTAITAPEHLVAAHGLLRRDGVPVTVIHDSPGFIAQRVVAMIVNIACDIAQQGIAAPDDINMAVQLGLGYPLGPLALGDRTGPATILDILEKMQNFYGDPRYRPSPWLKRRARLGVSLATPEA